MNCDRVRQNLCQNPGALERIRLRLHLLRCPACRAEAAQVRALDSALSALPRFTPSPELLSAVLAMTQAARQTAQTEIVGRASRRRRMPAGNERKTMKKLAYAVAFLIIVGLLAGGLLTKARPPDGRALLVSAAEAMEEAKTIYVRGRPNVSNAGSPAWGELGEGYYECWYSPDGSRNDSYDADGNLDHSLVMNVASGMAWTWSPPSQSFPDGLVTTYCIGMEALADIVEHARERFLEGDFWLSRDIEEGHTITTRTGTRNGKPVTVVEVDHGDIGTVEHYLDPASGRLLGLRQYGSESHGKPLAADMEIVEYGMDIPSSVFDFNPPPEALVLEGDFELREEGNYSLASAGGFRGPDQLTPTESWHASGSYTVRPTEPAFAIDSDFDTGWTAKGKTHLQEPGMWFQLTFDTPIRVSKMMIQHAPFGSGPAPGWPRGIQVSASADGIMWQDVYTGPAAADLPAFAYFGTARTAPDIVAIRLTLTEACDEEPWTISEIRLDGPPQF